MHLAVMKLPGPERFIISGLAEILPPGEIEDGRNVCISQQQGGGKTLSGNNNRAIDAVVNVDPHTLSGNCSFGRKSSSAF